MNKAQEMRKMALENIRCSEELVDKYYEYCLRDISFSAKNGYTKSHFWLYTYKDKVGEPLNEEGCKKFLNKLLKDGFKAENTISANGGTIKDMFEIAW